MRRRVVITGVGAVSPAGSDSKAHLAGLLAGRSLARTLDDDWYAPFEQAVGVPVTSVAESPELPRHVAFADLAVAEALAESGLGSHELARTSVVTSTAIAASVELEIAFRTGKAPKPGSFTFDQLTNRMPTHHAVGSQERSLTLSTGCTAGLDALGSAFDAIVSGRTRRVLVVSAEATMCPIVVAAFQKIGALSSRDVPPEQASCPFSADRDGFVLGEGAAAVVLEDLAEAKSRGAAPLVEMVGWGSVSSAYHMTRIRDTGEDIAASIRLAFGDAELPLDCVEAIDAHGTSTPLNDMSENAAFHSAFGPVATELPVIAQKGVNGHALGASNLLEVAGLSRYLPSGKLPPTANTTGRTLQFPLDLVLDEPRLAEPEVLVKTSSGFSGIHSAAVFRRTA